MKAEWTAGLMRRAAVHAALGDPGRLAIVDALLLGEASPTELQQLLDMPSNLLAHHVRTLEKVGVLTRHRSEADRRRTYLALAPGAFDTLRPVRVRDAVRVVFVCTHNSARSQLAVALWNDTSAVPATSAGTHPAATVHPGAIAAAQRHHVPLTPVPPRHVDDVLQPAGDGHDAAADLVITVCDAAHEELATRANATDAAQGGLHWSIPDPARTGEDAAFDRVVSDLTDRISRIAPAVRPAHRTIDRRRSDSGGPDAG
jgi:ArsR family transcriptional regulator, arsenate/arsenite/antimonite-responsive transcriptional repressor / arsenate reductase (thioredoxin)